MKRGANRRTLVGAGLGILLAAGAGTPVILQTLASHGFDVPTIAAPQSLLALLDARSPGEREKGALTATKTRKLASTTSDAKPHERALGKIIRPAPTAPSEFVQALTPPTPVVAAPAVAPPVTLADVIPPVTGTPGSGAPPITTLAAPPGGGNPGTPGTPGTPTTTVPDVPPAVPEPATWMMMLLGFGLIGSAMRRRAALPGATRAA